MLRYPIFLLLLAIFLLPSLAFGFTICIDPGHQEIGDSTHEQIAPGSTETKARVSTGTRGVKTGIPEYVFTLEFSFLLRERLIQEGFDVIMTRERHDVNIGNIERAKIANDANADLMIRIHADYSANGEVKGFMILIPSPDSIHTAPIYGESKRAAEKIMASLMNIDGISSLGIRQRSDITGFNWSEVPVLIFEAGFMSNPEEDVLLASQDYREKLVEALVSGISDYFLSR